MNYHIVFNNPYSIGFVEDICSLGEESNNYFWFRGSIDNDIDLPKSIGYSFLGDGYKMLRDNLSIIEPNDCVFVHYYDIHTARYLKGVPNKVFAFMWGGDFFQDPYWYHVKWVFAPKTRKYVLENEREKFIWRKNVSAMFKQFIKIYLEPKKLYKEKNEQMSFVDYVLCNEHNKADVQKARDLYPKLKAKHLGASYNLRFDQVLKVVEDNFQECNRVSGSKIKVLIGNSATTANNHLDVFDLIKQMNNIEVHCVLSYGDMSYAKFIAEKGVEIFGDNFKPMSDMKSPEEYIQYLNDMDVIIMNHHRSQAWGNISQCLAMGKPVFMNSENALKDYIGEIDLLVYDINDLGEIDLESTIEIEKSKTQSNREILKKISSDETRLKCLKNILENYT